MYTGVLTAEQVRQLYEDRPLDASTEPTLTVGAVKPFLDKSLYFPGTGGIY